MDETPKPGQPHRWRLVTTVHNIVHNIGTGSCTRSFRCDTCRTSLKVVRRAAMTEAPLRSEMKAADIKETCLEELVEDLHEL